MNENRQRAAKFLREYPTLCKNEKIINEQMCVIDRAMHSISISSPSSIPNYGGCSRYEDYLIGQLNKKDELKLRLAIVRMRRESITGLVDRLPPRQRAVVTRFFITGGSEGAAEDIMEQMSIEKSQVYRLKDMALDSIYEMMTECDNNASAVK